MDKEQLTNFFSMAVDTVNGKPMCITCNHHKTNCETGDMICEINNSKIENVKANCDLYEIIETGE